MRIPLLNSVEMVTHRPLICTLAAYRKRSFSSLWNTGAAAGSRLT
jgi:hypothetical protein